MAVKKQYSKFKIEWLMSRTHVGTSDLQVAKDIPRRTWKWNKQQRRMAVKDALNAHHANQELYCKVVSGQ